MGEAAGHPMPLLASVIRINQEQPRRTVELLRKHWPSLADLKVAVLGLSFKPETSDVRESPAFPIMRALLDEGAVVTAYDPVALHEARTLFPEPRVRYCETLEEAITGDAVIVVTPWKEFSGVPARLNREQRRVVFVDGRRTFDKASVPVYEGIGL